MSQIDKPFSNSGATGNQLAEMRKRALNGLKAATCCREGFAADAAIIGETVNDFSNAFRQAADNHINWLKEQIGQAPVAAMPVRVGANNALLAAAFRVMLSRFRPGGQNVTPYWYEEGQETFVEFGPSIAHWETHAPQALAQALGQNRLRARSVCEECVRKSLFAQNKPQKTETAKRRVRVAGGVRKTRPGSTSSVIEQILGEKFDTGKKAEAPTKAKPEPGEDPKRP